MAADPPRSMPEAEETFLISLWSHLDLAADLAVEADVLHRLDEILSHLDAATALIQAWQAET